MSNEEVYDEDYGSEYDSANQKPRETEEDAHRGELNSANVSSTASINSGGDESGVVTNIHVSNLDAKTSDSTLKTEIEKLGRPIKRVTIVRDKASGLSRCFGFVEMENEADVIPVKDALNGSELEGRTLRADLARRKTMHEKTPGRYLGGYLPGGYAGGRSSAGDRDSSRTERRDNYDRGRGDEISSNGRRFYAPSSSSDRRVDSYSSASRDYPSTRYDAPYRPQSGSRAYDSYESDRRSYSLEGPRTQGYGESYNSISRPYDNLRDSSFKSHNYDGPGNYRREGPLDRYAGDGDRSSDYLRRPRSRSRSRERGPMQSKDYLDHKFTHYSYRPEISDSRETIKSVSNISYSSASRNVGSNRDEYSQSRFSRPSDSYHKYSEDRNRTSSEYGGRGERSAPSGFSYNNNRESGGRSYPPSRPFDR